MFYRINTKQTLLLMRQHPLLLQELIAQQGVYGETLMINILDITMIKCLCFIPTSSYIQHLRDIHLNW